MATLTKSIGTVTLAGAAEKVTLPAFYGWIWIKNMSDSDIFAGLSEDISEGADGVLTIPSGECGRIQTDGLDSVYLMGTGNALVVAQNYAECPFKIGAKGGDGGDADTVNGHTVDADVPADAVFKYGLASTFQNGLMTTADKRKLNAIEEGANKTIIDSALSTASKNPVENDVLTAALADKINDNLLINPDFKINQRGITGTFSEVGKYFVDRWKLVTGTVTVNDDGSITLNGEICQPIEIAVGTNATASASAGTASYDDTAKMFTITASGETISWAKLEYGKTATAFVTPDTTAETLKCQRYYEIIKADAAAMSYDGTRYRYDTTVLYRVNKYMIPTVNIIGSSGTSEKISSWYSNTWNDLDTTITPRLDRVRLQATDVTFGLIGYTMLLDAEIY